jgi:AcrR family transcriptional regulator
MNYKFKSGLTKMTITDWPQIQTHILQFEQEGLVTRTFRRLDPDRQQAVLSAILDEAVVKGPASINIKEVAARAGVAVGSLYAYFGNRDGLLNFAVELCVRYMTDMFIYFETYLEQVPLREALAAYLTGGIEWSQTQTGLVHFFVRAAYHGDPEMAERVVRPIADTMRQMMHRMLTRAVERGEIRADLNLEAVTRVINALMIAVGDSQIMPYLNIYFQVTDDEVPPNRLLDTLLDFILRGVAP